MDEKNELSNDLIQNTINEFNRFDLTSNSVVEISSEGRDKLFSELTTKTGFDKTKIIKNTIMMQNLKMIDNGIIESVKGGRYFKKTAKKRTLKGGEKTMFKICKVNAVVKETGLFDFFIKFEEVDATTKVDAIVKSFYMSFTYPKLLREDKIENPICEGDVYSLEKNVVMILLKEFGSTAVFFERIVETIKTKLDENQIAKQNAVPLAILFAKVYILGIPVERLSNTELTSLYSNVISTIPKKGGMFGYIIVACILASLSTTTTAEVPRQVVPTEVPQNVFSNIMGPQVKPSVQEGPRVKASSTEKASSTKKASAQINPIIFDDKYNDYFSIKQNGVEYKFSKNMGPNDLLVAVEKEGDKQIWALIENGKVTSVSVNSYAYMYNAVYNRDKSFNIKTTKNGVYNGNGVLNYYKNDYGFRVDGTWKDGKLCFDCDKVDITMDGKNTNYGHIALYKDRRAYYSPNYNSASFKFNYKINQNGDIEFVFSKELEFETQLHETHREIFRNLFPLSEKKGKVLKFGIKGDNFITEYDNTVFKDINRLKPYFLDAQQKRANNNQDSLNMQDQDLTKMDNQESTKIEEDQKINFSQLILEDSLSSDIDKPGKYGEIFRGEFVNNVFTGIIKFKNKIIFDGVATFSNFNAETNMFDGNFVGDLKFASIPDSVSTTEKDNMLDPNPNSNLVITGKFKYIRFDKVAKISGLVTKLSGLIPVLGESSIAVTFPDGNTLNINSNSASLATPEDTAFTLGNKTIYIGSLISCIFLVVAFLTLRRFLPREQSANQNVEQPEQQLPNINVEPVANNNAVQLPNTDEFEGMLGLIQEMPELQMTVREKITILYKLFLNSNRQIARENIIKFFNMLNKKIGECKRGFYKNMPQETIRSTLEIINTIILRIHMSNTDEVQLNELNLETYVDVFIPHLDNILRIIENCNPRLGGGLAKTRKSTLARKTKKQSRRK